MAGEQKNEFLEDLEQRLGEEPFPAEEKEPELELNWDCLSSWEIRGHRLDCEALEQVARV